MLDALVDLAPAPRGCAAKGSDGNDVQLAADASKPFAALIWKTIADPFVGKLTYFRVYSGTLKKGSYVVNATRDKKERVGRIVRMHANHREDVDEVTAGDIAAAVGIGEATTGDTLCDEARPIVLEAIQFPDPVISIAIEPKTKADQDKLAQSLGRLSAEDPTFRIRTDEETGQTIIAGMGGNSGTQSLAVTVRRIALTRGSLERRSDAVAKEALVGLFNGLVLGLIAFVVSWIGVLTLPDVSPMLPWVVLFALCLAHAAHRFRYTLYDGLQLKRRALIAVLCYGGAVLGTVASLVVLVGAA